MVTDSKKFKKLELISRIKKITIEFKDYIDLVNSINVFPISDKDTGSNIYLTLKSFNETSSFQGVGNSGNILEVFGNEFLKNLPESFEIPDVRKAMEKGIKKLEDSVLELKEGTIYTVIKKLKECLEQGKTAEETLNELYNIVKESKKFIKQYTSQEVVDAGALGFLIVLWLLNNKKPEFNFESFIKSIKTNNDGIYCINLLCDSYDPEKLKTLDSLIINKIDNNKYKIHFHSKDIKSALEFKNPEIIKIDFDNRKQKNTLCFITDSEKEKEFFNNVGLKTISSLRELILETDPAKTLYVVKEQKKEIFDKIEGDKIIIKKPEEIFLINYILTEIDELNNELIYKKMLEYKITDKKKDYHIIFKICSYLEEDSLYFPFLEKKEVFIVKKKKAIGSKDTIPY